MIKMEIGRTEARFFGGSQYLERIDSILTEFNELYVLDKPEAMLKLICVYHAELECYMTNTERKENKENYEKAVQLWQDYMSEQQSNRKRKIAARQNTGTVVLYTTTKMFEFKNFLLEWRMNIQRVQKKAGLLMEDKQDASTALRRGLSE
jgi:hypothetical protein